MLSKWLYLALVGVAVSLPVKAIENLKTPISKKEALEPSKAFASDYVTKVLKQQISTQRAQSILSKIDLSQPRLAQVKAYADKANYAAALTALLRYYQTKQFVTQLDSRVTQFDRTTANDALSHYLLGNKKSYPTTFRGIEIDWQSPGFYQGKEITALEWGYQYNRQFALKPLVKLFTSTNNQDYAYEWAYQILSYKADNLPIAKNAPKRVRRGMETYYRLQGITLGYAPMLEWSQFNETLMVELLESIHYQTEHVRSVYAKRGNHLVGELMEVFQVGALFDEFKQAKQWRQDGIKRIPEMMFSESYSDGMNKELVFSYHTMYLRLYTQFLELVVKLGYQQSLPGNYVAHLKKMYQYPLGIVMPDLSYPQFGDGWKKAGYYRRTFAKAAQLFPEEPAFAFYATRGEKGKAPSQKLFSYPESGFYALRQGFAKDDTVVVVKNGAGDDWWHNQPDNMTFTLRALGKEFMNDSGSFVYGSKSPEMIKEREWFRKTSSHQTLTLNGENAARKPTHIKSVEHDLGLSVVLENNSYPQLTHRRTLTLLDDQYVVIYDEAIGKAQGQVELNFQLVPADVAVNNEALAVTTQFADDINVSVQTFAIDASNAKLQSTDGYISYEQTKKQSRPAWQIVQNKAEENLAWITVIAPFTGDKPEITAELIKGQLQNSYHIHIGDESYRFNL